MLDVVVLPCVPEKQSPLESWVSSPSTWARFITSNPPSRNYVSPGWVDGTAGV